MLYFKQMQWANKKRAEGFTVVELLIVIIVIAILAAIVIVTYNGAQERARSARVLSDMKAMEELVEAYASQNSGAYPVTTSNPKANWKSIDVNSDDNCTNGSSLEEWIPGIGEKLPQSDPSVHTGADGKKGCYLYASNGTHYVISAWNMLEKPQTSEMYRRLGFRQFSSDSSTQFYTCNDNVVGGANGGYDASRDYYKHSYTISNITDCNETPPPGA